MPDPTKQAIDRILYGTSDPTVSLDGKPLPAMTTMLHRVCDNDTGKFEEAVRLVELFIGKALNDAWPEPPTSFVPSTEQKDERATLRHMLFNCFGAAYEKTPNYRDMMAQLDDTHRRESKATNLRRLAVERYVALADAAIVLSEKGNSATIEEWAAFHSAVAGLPPKGVLS